MKVIRALLIRLVVALVATGVWWWIGVRFGGVEVRPEDPGGKFTALIWFMFTGLIWGITLGLPAIIAWAESWGSLFWPSDKSLRIRPEYGIAESRVKQGRYAEAIDEYRKAAEQFPEETTPHLRIAELLLQRQHDPEGAIVELEAALPKAHGDDVYAALRHRLADLYVEHHGDRAAARELMRQIQQQFPNSRHARAAAERLERLRDNV